MSDRETIVDVLRRLRWRLRLSRVLEDMAAAMGAVLLVWLASQWFPWTASVRYEVLSLAGVVLGILLIWRLLRRETLARVAGVVDRRCGLKDELKTAYHFMRDERSSPWTDLQIHYAASTAHGLERKEVIPLALPKKYLLADGLLLAVGLFWVISHDPDWNRDPGALRRAALSELDERVRGIETLLQTGEVDRSAEDRGNEALRRLDDTFSRFEKGQISVDEGLQELQETENLLTDASLEAGAIQDDLDRVAGDMDGEGPLADVADALRNQQLEEAAELLRELAAAETTENLDRLLNRLELAETRSARMEEWIQSLRQAVEALREGDLSEAENLWASADEEVKTLSLKLSANQRLGEAGVELERLRSEMAQDKAAGLRTLQLLDEGSQELAEALAALGLPASEQKLGGNPDGLPVGPLGSSDAMEMDSPTPLDVQLEREVLGSEEEPDSSEEDIRERPSRRQTSALSYEAVRGRSQYADADVMSPERIPWPYRSLVRNYFRALRQVLEQ